jgi:hypothetical protein
MIAINLPFIWKRERERDHSCVCWTKPEEEAFRDAGQGAALQVYPSVFEACFTSLIIDAEYEIALSEPEVISNT